VAASSELRAVTLETLVLTPGDANCEKAPNESVIRVDTVRLPERGSRVCQHRHSFRQKRLKPLWVDAREHSSSPLRNL
jgi:hypothetical protein